MQPHFLDFAMDLGLRCYVLTWVLLDLTSLPLKHGNKTPIVPFLHCSHI